MSLTNREISDLSWTGANHENGTNTKPSNSKHLRIVQILKNALEPNVFDMWFGDGGSIVVQADCVRILVDSEFLLMRLQSRYSAEIRQSIDLACGPGFPAVYSISSAVEPDLVSCAAPVERISERANVQSPVSRRKGIESFWFGQSNRLAQAGVMQMFEQLGRLSPLVVYGPTGCGKTHLLESLVVDARRKYQLKRCVFLSAEQFTSNFVEALRGTGLPVFRRKYRDLDLLAIDDVQFFAGKNATLAEFQYTIDHLNRNGKQVVLSSDRPPADLGRLGSDISARLMSGLVFPLNYPDAEGRRRIVMELCRQRGFEIPNGVIDLISQNLARDVRRLSGAVNRLHAFSIAAGIKVDTAMARQALTDLFSVNGTATSIGTVEKAVCDFCGVKPSDLKSTSRRKSICAARMLAMYLSRQYTPNAYSEIGDYFGRSHSTVIAAHRKISAWLADNQPIHLPHANYLTRDAVVQIESSLRVG